MHWRREKFLTIIATKINWDFSISHRRFRKPICKGEIHLRRKLMAENSTVFLWSVCSSKPFPDKGKENFSLKSPRTRWYNLVKLQCLRKGSDNQKTFLLNFGGDCSCPWSFGPILFTFLAVRRSPLKKIIECFDRNILFIHRSDHKPDYKKYVGF